MADLHPRLEGTTTTIQPSPGTQATDVQAGQALASQQAKTAGETQQVAGQVQQVASQVMRDEALKHAQENAAEVLTPADIEANRGWGGLVYNQAYTQAALAQYAGIAIDEVQVKGRELLTKFPSNPDAVRAGMTSYVDSKKKAMTPFVANRLTPHFDAAVRGTVAASEAGKARQDMQVGEREAKRQLDGYIVSYAAAIASDAYSGATLEQRQQTDQLYAEKWGLIAQQLETHGFTPTHIAQIREESAAATLAHYEGRQFQRAAATLKDKPVELAQLEEDARAWAEDPKRAKHISTTLPILQGYIERGARTANAIRQQIGIDQQFRTGAIADRHAELEANKNKDIDAYLRGMEKLKADAVNMGIGLMPGMKAQLLAAAGDSSPTVHAAYGAALLQATGKAMYGQTDQIQKDGVDEVRRIIADQQFVNLSATSPQAAAMMQQGQRLVSGAYFEGKALDVLSFRQHLQSGNVDPANALATLEGGKRLGLVGRAHGQLSVEDASKDLQIGLAKQAEVARKQTDSVQAAKGWRRTDGGTPMPADAPAIKAHEAANPSRYFKPDISGKLVEDRFAWNNPSDRNTALSKVQQLGYLEPQAKSWIGTLNEISPIEQQQVAVAMEDSINQIVAQQYAHLPDGIRGDYIYRATQEILGPEAGARTNAFRKHMGDPKGIAAAMKVDPPGRNASNDAKDGTRGAIVGQTMADIYRTGTSQGYAGGQPPLLTEARQGMDRWINTLMPNWGTATESSRKLAMWINHEAAALVSSFKQIGLDNAQTDLEGNVLPPPIKGDNVYMDPELVDLITNTVGGEGGLMEQNGQKSEAAGHNARKQAVLQAMQMHRSKISTVWTTDPGTGQPRQTLTLNHYGQAYNNHWATRDKQNYTEKEWLSAATLVAKVRGQYILGQADLTSGQIEKKTHPDGRTEYWMRFENKDLGKPSFRVSIDPTDPMHEPLRRQAAANVEQMMRTNGVLNFVSTTWGPDVVKHLLAQGLREDVIMAASGRTQTGENWAGMIGRFREAFTSYVALRQSVGDNSVIQIPDKDWQIMQTDEYQKNINLRGTLYTMLFGIDEIPGLLGEGRVGRTDRPPADVTTPPITIPTAQDLERSGLTAKPPKPETGAERAERLRQQRNQKPPASVP